MHSSKQRKPIERAWVNQTPENIIRKYNGLEDIDTAGEQNNRVMSIVAEALCRVLQRPQECRQHVFRLCGQSLSLSRRQKLENTRASVVPGAQFTE